MNLNEELGVKGYCFRGYPDNPTVAAKIKECGVNRVDLSGPQCDFRDPDLHETTIETFRNAGVKIVGIGAVQLHGDQADEQYFQFCKKAGCRTVSCAGKPETFFDAVAQADRWAQQYDMFVAIHNHGGKHWLGNSEMLQYVLGKVSPRVGLCIDTAWCLHAGEDPVQWLEMFAGRIHAVHYKDFVFDRRGKHRDVIVGEGALDLPAFVKGLKAGGFEGPAVIEYEADVENPVPALRKCVQKMRPILQAADGE
ncbi:MAG: sugar phosphate isomerase/epimerase [Phycisphaerae bacterium]|nr:sugar phosphate isomerase/epimerase [Phycisphaerae bacterium]